MNYTKSDLQLSDKALMNAIIQVGKELEKMDTPRGRALNARLLSNINEYDTIHTTKMLNDFQRLLVDSIPNVFGILNAELLVKNKLPEIKEIITSQT